MAYPAAARPAWLARGYDPAASDICVPAEQYSPRHLRKRTRSQGPLLRRHYPASTLLRPCPTPAMTVACRDVEAATLAPNGSPPITRTTFPTCRAHYPGGSSGCACRLLPHACGLPQMTGGSASALSLSRPAQAIAVGTAITGRPPQIRTRPTKASGSYLGCLTSKRSSGQG